MNNFENNTSEQNIERIKPENLIIGKKYKITSLYTMGKYEGQAFEGEVEFLEAVPNSDNGQIYRFLYTKKPEHMEEVGDSSTYQTNESGLQYINELE